MWLWLWQLLVDYDRSHHSKYGNTSDGWFQWISNEKGANQMMCKNYAKISVCKHCISVWLWLVERIILSNLRYYGTSMQEYIYSNSFLNTTLELLHFSCSALLLEFYHLYSDYFRISIVAIKFCKKKEIQTNKQKRKSEKPSFVHIECYQWKQFPVFLTHKHAIHCVYTEWNFWEIGGAFIFIDNYENLKLIFKSNFT